MILNPCFSFILSRCYRLPIAALSAVLLTACQTLPSYPSVEGELAWRSSPEIFLERRQRTEMLNSWRYSAKIGLFAPGLNEQANLVWQFADQSNDIRLYGPLGVGAIKLQFDQYGVVLSDNKGLLHRGTSAEQLLTRIVGWPIPIDALSSWMFVLPTKQSTYRYRLDENQQIETLEQLGWTIEYSDYRDYGGQLMPKKVVATKTLAGQKLRLLKDKNAVANGRNAVANGRNAVANGRNAVANGRIVIKLITKSWAL
ncbi:MAG: outer membrane lipoprotein LolB [Chitinophagales bacterium]|jgi:outer membrane lipoprotein LolB